MRKILVVATLFLGTLSGQGQEKVMWPAPFLPSTAGRKPVVSRGARSPQPPHSPSILN